VRKSRFARSAGLFAEDAYYQRSDKETAAHKRDVVLAAVAVLALVATGIIGTIGAAAFILLALILATLRIGETVRDLIRFAPLLILPLLAILSTIWSDAPERTLRAGLQLLITIVAAISVSRGLSPRSMVLVLYCGFLASCLLAIPDIPASLQTGSALSGPYESKNQMGFTAQFLMASALAVTVDPRQFAIARISGVVAIPISFLLLFLAQSSGAQTTAAITLITFPVFLVFGRVNISFRIGLLLVMFVMITIVMILLPDFLAAWTDFRQSVLKKDATLTGRTYLWEVAARLNAEKPFLGRGYYAFWREGNLDAEGLWRWGGITGRHGFNFHNAFIEIQVDLGWVGQAILIVISIWVAAVAMLRQFLRPSIHAAFLLSLILVIYARSYAESGLLSPFSLLTFLWIAVAAYSHAPPASEEPAAKSQAYNRANYPQINLRHAEGSFNISARSLRKLK
jgi:exopolysaccharide production protein ExoQ